MSIVLIVIYCLIAAGLVFGLTFHDELLNEQHRQQRIARSFTVIRGGKKIVTRPHRHA